MNDRDLKILAAAKQVFSRYGVKRTSMSDLADAAGVSRQTLYNAFKNKDEIVRAWIKDYADEAVAAIEVEQSKAEDLGALLDAAFAKIAIESYDLISSSPNAEELIEGFNSASVEEWQAVALRFRNALAKAFAPYHTALKAKGMEPEDLADLVYPSMKAAKSEATSRSDLLRRLETLKRLCLLATRAP